MADREWIAWRVAQELREGDAVNLGIGIPTLVPKYLPKGMNVYFQSENGIVGMGAVPLPEQQNDNLVDAAGKPTSIMTGGVVFDSSFSFALIRGGHLDFAVLGALEVDAQGRIANWMIPGKMVPGMGGGMDLAVGAKKVIVAMTHTASGGKPKILSQCSLPLTSTRPVNKIITDLAVIQVDQDGLVLCELAPGATIDGVLAATGARLQIGI
ncbi:3-oxoacid CoA-transferase subunit B [Candidatus Formimonas warabiya]|uniref:Succinyl-CoA--3-ketoacid-CoA transferase n=1 Tax=Formimonas warabiya TaxID=1761012 RepID=A0A3G1KZD4_FORW1|nr:3-oxoacid CoA-transferase subunit B [Candidatus Formimonas warabiya]ATW27768.1 succinyl-CoA--3-ketoacid-CoA transferase [Candidatus Formimonas warabiya]